MKRYRRIRKAPQPDLVDLHVHCSASDGAISPAAVVHHAAEVGLKAIALTDHDTVAGVAEAVAAGAECGVEVIAGVEISAEFEPGSCHILGYFIDCDDAALGDVLAEARDSRKFRNDRILARVNELGLAMTMEEVAGRVKDGVVTRGHFAAVMVAKGYVKSWDDAFDRYLGRDRPAFVPRPHVTPGAAIEVVRRAGGLAVLAHPRQLGFSPRETDAYIEKLAAAGLDGVETASPDHTVNLGRRYKAAAERLGLVETGGTDWHGRDDGGIHLGLGRGSMAIHYTLVEKMKARLAKRSNS
jgi:hypothetical protein